MPGKTPNGNGKEPVENGGYPGSKDIEMKDDSSSLQGKGKKGIKDGDEEMTVVVPMSKKQSSQPPTNDADGDVDMEDTEKDGEAKVDPVAQTVSGTYNPLPRDFFWPMLILDSPTQISRAISHSLTEPSPSSMPDSLCERCDPSPPSANDSPQTYSPRSSSRPSQPLSHLEMSPSSS